MIDRFNYSGVEFYIERPMAGTWVIKTSGLSLMFGAPDWDLDKENGDDVTYWGEFAIEAFCDAGLLQYDEWSNKYITTEQAAEDLREAGHWRDHINSYRLRKEDVL